MTDWEEFPATHAGMMIDEVEWERLRNNLLHLSEGGGGVGTDPTGVTRVTFTALDKGSPLSGDLWRGADGHLRYRHGSTTYNVSASGQAAGTPAPRQIGTSATQGAAGNHTHAF